MIKLLISTVALSACAGLHASEYVDLRQVTARPTEWEGQLVRTCGMATNQFENRNIWVAGRQTLFDGDGREWGLRVRWTRRAQITTEPVWACVTGTIERIGCAAEAICLDSSFKYQIVERDL